MDTIKPPAIREKPEKSEQAAGLKAGADASRPREYGGRGGPDPVRYGDWEIKGRCIDF